jgi:hypothetical protein
VAASAMPGGSSVVNACDSCAFPGTARIKVNTAAVSRVCRAAWSLTRGFIIYYMRAGLKKTDRHQKESLIC